jgi:hypothetical protein
LPEKFCPPCCMVSGLYLQILSSNATVNFASSTACFGLSKLVRVS